MCVLQNASGTLVLVLLWLVVVGAQSTGSGATKGGQTCVFAT